MNKLLTAALAGVMAASVSHIAMADEGAGKEKCYGIAKAGENSCASANKSHSCAGQAKTDHDANEWKFVAAGECEKLGGKLNACKSDAGKNSCKATSGGKNSCQGATN